jgi:hypothetical protein
LQVRVQVCFRYTCRASYGVLFGLQLDADCDVFAGRSQNVSVAVSSWVAWLMAGALKKQFFCLRCYIEHFHHLRLLQKY